MVRLSMLAILVLAACSGSHTRAPSGHDTGTGGTGGAPPCCAQEAFAWQDPTGPRSLGIAAGLVVNEFRIVVATSRGISVSRDGAASWKRSASDITVFLEGQLRQAGSMLLVVDRAPGTLSVSSNDGDTWTQPLPGLSVISVSTLGSEAWASGWDESFAPHLVHSLNGLSWSALAPLARTVVPCGDALLSAGDDRTLSISDDAGKSWMDIPAPIGFTGTSLLACSGGTIVTVAPGASETWSLVSSSDRGQHWKSGYDGLRLGWRAFLTDSADGVFLAGALGEILRLPDPAGPWEVVQMPEHLGATLVDALYGGSEGAYLASRGQLLRFDPTRHAFAPVGDRPVQSYVNALAHDGEVLWAVVDGREVHRSPDGGRSWVRVESPASDSIVAVTARGGSVWAGTTQDGLYRSDDGGQHWLDLSASMPHYNGTAGDQPRDVSDLLATSDGLYVSTSGLEFLGATEGNFQFTSAGVLFSTDGGQTFQAHTRGLPGVPNLPLGSENALAALGRLTEAGGTLFVSGVDGLYRSTDRGASWVGPSRIASDGPVKDVLDVVLAGDRLLAGFLADAGSGLFESTDGGATFHPADSRPPGNNVVAGLVEQAGKLSVLLVSPSTAPESNEGVWTSTDGGSAWRRWGDGAPARGGQHLLATEKELLVPTMGRGVARLPTGGEH